MSYVRKDIHWHSTHFIYAYPLAHYGAKKSDLCDINSTIKTRKYVSYGQCQVINSSGSVICIKKLHTLTQLLQITIIALPLKAVTVCIALLIEQGLVI